MNTILLKKSICNPILNNTICTKWIINACDSGLYSNDIKQPKDICIFYKGSTNCAKVKKKFNVLMLNLYVMNITIDKFI